MSAIVCVFCDRLIHEGQRPIVLGLCEACKCNAGRWKEWVRVLVATV